MQWYSNPNAAITDGLYRLRPSNTTGVRSAALMSSKSGVRNGFHLVTIGEGASPRPQAASFALASRLRLTPSSAAWSASCRCTSGGMRTRNSPL